MDKYNCHYVFIKLFKKKIRANNFNVIMLWWCLPIGENMQLHDKLWSFTEDNNINLQEFAEHLGVSTITAKLLSNREIDNIDDARVFLHPKLSHLHDPFLLKDMDKAAERINRAIEGRENIWVCGSDYIDGMTSVAILCRYFMSINFEVSYSIFNQIRLKSEISIESIDHIKSMGGDLIICADCQVEASEIVEYAYSKNVDIIIIDNIVYEDDVPKSRAVINPRRKESTYPYEMLSCVGIALKLIQGLTPGEEFSKEYCLYLDIVALGTLTGKVPVTGENRVLAKIGLDVLRNTTNIGLKAFLQKLGCTSENFKIKGILQTITSLTFSDERGNVESVIVKLLLSQSHNEVMMICEDLYSNFMANDAKIEKYVTPICEIDMEIDIKDISFN